MIQPSSDYLNTAQHRPTKKGALMTAIRFDG